MIRFVKICDNSEDKNGTIIDERGFEKIKSLLLLQKQDCCGNRIKTAYIMKDPNITVSSGRIYTALMAQIVSDTRIKGTALIALSFEERYTDRTGLTYLRNPKKIIAFEVE